MPYRRSHRNIHLSVVRRAERLLRSQPWFMTDPERCRHTQTFLEKSLKGYGHEVTVQVRTSYISSPIGFEHSVSPTVQNALGTDEHVYEVRFGSRYSTPPVFTALRVIERELAGEAVDAIEASTWANSLLWTVAPHVFRKLGRKGRLVGVKAINTFSAEDAALLMEHGYLREDGSLSGRYTPGTVARLRDLAPGATPYAPLGYWDVEEDCEDEYDEDDGLDDPDLVLNVETDPAFIVEPFERPASTPEIPVEATEMVPGGGYTIDGLLALNRDQVRQIAREHFGISNVSSYPKVRLVEKIIEVQRSRAWQS